MLQPETLDEFKQLALLTADLLKKRQDINDVNSPFTQWSDSICFPAAEIESFNYTSFSILETTLSADSGASIWTF